MDGRSGSCTWQRYEAKYLVSEAQAAEIRRCCLQHLAPDRHARQQPGWEYPVVSVYLDSPSRMLLLQTVHKQEQRFKLRVRSYRPPHEWHASDPTFFEIKRKSRGVVQKTRSSLRADLGASVLRSQDALFDGSNGAEPIAETNLNEFLHLRRSIGARPVVGVAYTRQAFQGTTLDRVRVTLDRKLHCGVFTGETDVCPASWWPVRTRGVILEVKFTNVYPRWMADLLRRVEVVRRGVCKYVLCAQAAGGWSGRTSLRGAG